MAFHAPKGGDRGYYFSPAPCYQGTKLWVERLPSPIAYLMLCHKDPEGVIAQARALRAGGDYVAVHYDRAGGQAAFAKLKAAFAGDPGLCLLARRFRCGWGDFTLVDASLALLRAAYAAFPEAGFFYLISGDCFPVKPGAVTRARLAETGRDWIEAHDFFTSNWIQTGLREERLIYRHPFNERRQRWLFYTSLALQKRLGLRRALPHGLRVHIGSQWWALRRQTVEALFAFLKARPDVTRFFRLSWIPDESFFQTLVRHLVPEGEVENRSPTFLMFSDYGMPVTFYDDHHDLLLAEDALFARKISPEAEGLRARLLAQYALPTEGGVAAEPGGGRALHRFLTGRGRQGRRFAPRIWEAGARLGRGRQLYLIACKKWHVAKRLADQIAAQTGLPALHYVFEELGGPLPDLGGVEKSLEKRNRHRRAVMRMIFAGKGSDRMVLCTDPGHLALIRDFYEDRAELRLLEVQCQFSDAYLTGHAGRLGLVQGKPTAGALRRLLPALRAAIAHESEEITEAGFARLTRLREGAPPAQNAAALAAFLGLAPEAADAILNATDLFAD